MVEKKRYWRPHLVFIITLFGLILAMIISICIGAKNIELSTIYNALFQYDATNSQHIIIRSLRIPRILIAAIVGASFAVSEAIMQGMARNPMASLSILGINAGAAFGLAIAMAFFPNASFNKVILFSFAGAGFAVMLFTFFAPDNKSFGIFILPFISLVGAMTTALLIYSLASEKGQPIAPVRLVLIGISISAGINALELVLTVRMTPEKFNSVNTWLIGSVYGSSWKHVLALLPWILIIIPFFIYSSKRLNLLRLSDGIAIGLGSNLSRERLLYLALAVANKLSYGNSKTIKADGM